MIQTFEGNEKEVKSVFATFIDLKKAFNNVNKVREKILEDRSKKRNNQEIEENI